MCIYYANNSKLDYIYSNTYNYNVSCLLEERYFMNQEAIYKANNSLSMVLNDYYDYFKLKPMNTMVTLTNDIGDLYKNKRPELFKKGLINLDYANSTRGTMIPPKILGEDFTIAIDINYFFNSTTKNDWQWAGTLTHEMTHVYDYSNYVKMNRLDNYDMVQYEFIHRPFVLWSEFHAKAIGDLFIRKYTYGDRLEDENDYDQIDNILDIEFPNKKEMVLKSLNGNSDDDFYAIMHFMGSYSVWEKLFPNVFNEEFRKITFEGNDMLLNLYDFLLNHQTLEEANKDFDKMMKLITE